MATETKQLNAKQVAAAFVAEYGLIPNGSRKNLDVALAFFRFAMKKATTTEERNFWSLARCHLLSMVA